MGSVLRRNDISNAYVHPKFGPDDPVYVIDVPDDYPLVDQDARYLELCAPFYGLQEAGNMWNATLDKRLRDYGFVPSPAS